MILQHHLAAPSVKVIVHSNGDDARNLSITYGLRMSIRSFFNIAGCSDTTALTKGTCHRNLMGDLTLGFFPLLLPSLLLSGLSSAIPLATISSNTPSKVHQHLEHCPALLLEVSLIQEVCQFQRDISTINKGVVYVNYVLLLNWKAYFGAVTKMHFMLIPCSL